MNEDTITDMGLARIMRQFAADRGVILRRQANGGTDALRFLRPQRTEHALVRLGGPGDGGYLVPDDLDGIAAVFSPGVDAEASFEADCLARGMLSFQIDGQVEGSPITDPNNRFEQRNLGLVTDAKTVTLKDWVATAVPDSTDDLMLQMDIEGHEWLALAQADEETLSRFRIMVIELHYLDALLDGIGEIIFPPVLDKLLRQFAVVHLHTNNVFPGTPARDEAIPAYVEITLLRRDRIRQAIPLAANDFPHPLDRENVPGEPTVPIPKAVFA